MKLYNDREDFIECIPNVSEGRDMDKIRQMAEAIASETETQLLNIDANADANRTVFTFCGPAQSVFNSAGKLIDYCAHNINMEHHQGAHPCIGAVDVCPFVILGNNDEKVLLKQIEDWAKEISASGNIPIYFYEKSAKTKERQNLANIRKGNYPKLEERMKTKEWKPDLGDTFNPTFGAMVTGLRDFLVAFNIGVPGISLSDSRDIAAQIRYSADSPYSITGVKAIGWSMPQYDESQVSVNITDTINASLFHLIENVMSIAENKYNGSEYNTELIGLMPKYFLQVSQDEFGSVDFEEFAQDIQLRHKSKGIPSIEFQIENPCDIDTLMALNS